ncbi:MAG: hypothetical protein J6K89_09330 [Oscillospiraceae bacterium]|nr:hypothetical protein [Oscillospiraceae bacterium]
MYEVIQMTNDIEMLNSIRKSTQMGCYGIKTVMAETSDANLYSELKNQLSEYEKIYDEADALLKERGGKAKNINPMAKYSSSMSATMQVRMAKDPNAKIADLMMRGNTKGMIKSIHNHRSMGVLDPKVSCLSNRLLQTEQANIDSMKTFL